MTTEERLAKVVGVPIKIRQMPIGKYVVNYAVAGSGPPLLLIHGANFGWGVWYPNIAEFAKHFTVYAIDLPGAGRSTRVEYGRLDFDAVFAEIVKQFVHTLDFPSVSLIGHSIGGWVANRLAVLDPSRIAKLILVDPVGFSAEANLVERVIFSKPFSFILSKTFLYPHRKNIFLEKFLRSGFKKTQIKLPQEFIDYFYENTQDSAGVRLISRIITDRKSLLLGGAPHFLDGRTMIVWGANDGIIPLSRSQERLRLIFPGNVAIFDDAGHVPSIEQARKFNETAMGFLENSA